MYLLCAFARTPALTAFVLLALSAGSHAQTLTDVCLKNGVTVHALKIEPRQGAYFVFPQGQNSQPLTIPADQIREIGAACNEDRFKLGGEAKTPLATGNASPDSPRFGVHGSQTIGARLAPMLIEAYARKRGWSAIAKPTGPGSQEIVLTQPGAPNPAAIIELNLSSSADGMAALSGGRAAIAMSDRRAAPEEAARMKAAFGVDPLTPASGAEHVVALDAVALIVHRDNPVKRLRLDQIAGIFSGKVANWKDVRGWTEVGEEANGEDGAIQVHALDVGSDSSGFFADRALAPYAAALTPSTRRHDSGKKLSQAVGKDPYAIGFAPLANVGKNDALSVATTCGLSSEASRFGVKTESYPLMRRLYLYSAGELKQQAAREFLQFALSDEAQASVADAGFIDQSIEYQDRGETHRWVGSIKANPLNGLINDHASDAARADQRGRLGSEEGKKLIDKMLDSFLNDTSSGEVRTSIVFRFETNSSNLDARALQDVERLARHLQAKRARGVGMQNVYHALLGFADSYGNILHNLRLSQARAKRVEDQIRQTGTNNWVDPFSSKQKSNAYGYSSFAPIACNDSEEGRTLNRRVETWVSDN